MTSGSGGRRLSGGAPYPLDQQPQLPEDYHTSWKTQLRLTEANCDVIAHKSALRALAIGGFHDQLDLPNFIWAEHCAREVELAEYYYRCVAKDQEDKLRKEKNMMGPPSEEMTLWSFGAWFCWRWEPCDHNPSDAPNRCPDGRATFPRAGHLAGGHVCPSIEEWIGKDLENDAQISKQAKKARVERALTHE
jgi:hypothetical protein